MADYHFLLSADYNYTTYSFVACQSILDSLEDWPENAQDQLIFHIIFDETVGQFFSESHVAAFTEFNPNPKVKFQFDLIHTTSQQFHDAQVFENSGLKVKSPYYRIIFNQLLPEGIDRILYMDCDMMVRTDIRKIFKDYPMQDEILCAVSTNVGIFLTYTPFAPEPLIELESKQDGGEPLTIKQRDYFNSGLLLINVKQWVAYGVEQRALEIADKWNTKLHDQDMLNAVCQGHVTYMDWRWNLSHALYLLGYYKRLANPNSPLKIAYEDLPLHASAPAITELDHVINNPYIVHFTDDKPWFTLIEPKLYQGLGRLAPDRMQFHDEWFKLFRRMLPMFSKLRQDNDARKEQFAKKEQA